MSFAPFAWPALGIGPAAAAPKAFARFAEPRGLAGFAEPRAFVEFSGKAAARKIRGLRGGFGYGAHALPPAFAPAALSLFSANSENALNFGPKLHNAKSADFRQFPERF
jgi:hypothetical protein